MMTSCSTIHSVSRLPSPGFSLIGHLNLDSELDLDLDFDLGLDDANNGPAAATISASDPATAIAQPTAVPASRRQFTAHSLDTTLPFFFPQTSNNVRVKFARTEDEAQIRARWEAARGELTRDWKRRHREAVKSQRRRRGGGGGGGERVE